MPTLSFTHLLEGSYASVIMILEGHGASYTHNHLANFAGMDRKSGPVKTGPTRVVDTPTPVCGLLKLTWVYYSRGNFHELF